MVTKEGQSNVRPAEIEVKLCADEHGWALLLCCAPHLTAKRSTRNAHHFPKHGAETTQRNPAALVVGAGVDTA